MEFIMCNIATYIKTDDLINFMLINKTCNNIVNLYSRGKFTNYDKSTGKLLPCNLDLFNYNVIELDIKFNAVNYDNLINLKYLTIKDMINDVVYPFNKLVYFEAHISVVDTIISDTLESVTLANTSTKVIIGKKIKRLAIKDGMITELKGVPNLEHLELINCKKITDISYLNKLTALYAKDSTIDKFYSEDLTKLYIQGTNVVELPHPLIKCKEANISCTQIIDVRHLSNVEVLNISYTNITDVSLLRVLKSITLQFVDINIYTQLCNIKTLERIYITELNYIAVYS